MNVMTRISVQAGPARFSCGEFLRMAAFGAFDEMWVELIAGEIQRMPPPGNQHSALQAQVVITLGAILARALIRSEPGIDLGDDTIVAADAAVLAAPYDGDGMIPADRIALVVEVAVSTRDRDLELKRRLYAAAGIPTYWVIDADRGVTHVFDRPERGDYMGLALARFGEPLIVPGADRTVVLE